MTSIELQRQERPRGPRFPIGTAAITRDETNSVEVIATAIAQDDSASIETIARSLEMQKPRDAYVANVLLLCYKIANLQCRHQANFDDHFAAGVDVALRLINRIEFANLKDADQRIAYAFRSISNEIIDQQRRRAAESRGIEKLFHEQLAETKHKRNEIEELEHTEHILSQLKRLEECLVGDDLMDVDREVVEAIRRNGDMSSKELASELGTSVDSARQRLHRAKKRLRKALCLDENTEDDQTLCPKKPSTRSSGRRKTSDLATTPDSSSPFTSAPATIASTVGELGAELLVS
jgi:RNA polymerase sigma factor (sigma-70 family)